MVCYVGIDPSLTAAAIFCESEERVIKTTTKNTDLDRFKTITDEIFKIIFRQKEDVVVGIEGFSFGSRGRGVSKMYGIGWAIRIMLHEKNIPFYEITPTALKKFATGSGKGEKALILKAVYKKWNYDTNNNNLADAYVLWKVVRHIHEETIPELEYEKEVIEKLQKQKV